MKKPLNQICRFVVVTLLLVGSTASAQWTNINHLNNFFFEDIQFPSELIGYSIMRDHNNGLNTIYKTTDAGLSWADLNVDLNGLTGINMNALYFRDDLSGYLLTRGVDSNSVAGEYLFSTADGGLNWSDVSPDSLQATWGVSGVVFPNMNTGYVAAGNEILWTKDAAQTWKRIVTDKWGGVSTIDFYDKDHVIVGGWDGTFAYYGRIYTTTDGGAKWDSLIIDVTNSHILKVCYPAMDTAYAMTSTGWAWAQKIYRTTDGGQTWDSSQLDLLVDSFDQATDMYFLNAKLGYITTQDGHVLQSTDHGQTWIRVHFEVQGLREIAFNGSGLYIGGPINMLLSNNQKLGIGDPNKRELELRFYPNPSSGLIRIEGDDLDGAGSIQLFDLEGKLVLERPLSSSIDLSDLSSGLYCLKVETKEGIQLQRLIKE